MKLRSFTPMGRRLLASCSETAASLFANERYGNHEDELVIVTPQVPLRDAHSETSDSVSWDEIHHAWAKIQPSRPGTQIHAWRVIWQYGQEIAPGFGVFRLRDGEIPRYFCLLAKEDIYRALDRLTGIFIILSAWQHITRGRGFLHAAGVIRGNSAYLFVGHSGAGKSTVASLSAARGCTSIHEDHVVVYPTQAGGYLVTDSSMSAPGAPLKRIFFLIQDATDQLIPLSLPATAKRLLESFLDSAGHQVLFGQALRHAFATSAAIARSVPGYELHFRKSPDFWDMIDAELGT
jgi:hypothetical protein